MSQLIKMTHINLTLINVWNIFVKDLEVNNMQDLNQSLKDVLYMVSNIIEKDSNRNYGDRDKYLHKLHITWNDFINNHPESLSLLDLVLKDSIYFKADITLDMNLNPWKYSTQQTIRSSMAKNLRPHTLPHLPNPL